MTDRIRNLMQSIGLPLPFGVACLLLSVAPSFAAKPDTPAQVDFSRDIRPLLSDRCIFCHGPDATHREADLRLDTKEGLFEVVEAGDADASDLIDRITSDDDDERMPPAESGRKLDDEQKALLRRWIDQGAEWEQHWAYVPPVRHAIPKVDRSDWPRNWIDPFVLSALQDQRLTPAPDADRATLARRVHFDLIGLPPDPDVVDRFVKDKDPKAYEKMVDRLLASEHYGERMAMSWLDLVRFADTVGYHGDQDHSISPYRDYVIDAFNANVPLDKFTRQQLAGDLIARDSMKDLSADEITDLKIASGYNRLLQTTHEGGAQPKEYMAIYAADRIRNVSAVWMGATMGCCQCHDHKFDPYTAKDFYSLAAVFSDIDEKRMFNKGTNRIPTLRPPEIKVVTRRDRVRIVELDAKIAACKADETETIAKWTAQRDALKKQSRMTMITVSVEPRVTRLLARGDWMDDSGPIMEPASPEFLGKLKSTETRATRLDLANWLVDPTDGVGRLTARVFANRFWYLAFGRGLASDLDDFGGQGQPPTHPELLDNLAVEFVENGWDVKQMMRLLVTSHAYRQSSVSSADLRARDPLNQWFARQSRYRLPAEIVRDNALAISGLLVDDVGGASVKPYQPSGYYRHLNFPTRKYHADTDARQWRRGLYVHWQRQFLHPALKAMDAPSREECTAERPRSNTPLEALALLNDPTFVEAARVFAERILREGGASIGSRMNFAFRTAVSRSPDSFERRTMAKLLKANGRAYQENPTAAQGLIGVGQADQGRQVDPIELAAWTTVARALLNMNETVTRN